MTPAKGAIVTLCIKSVSICAQLAFFVLVARAASIDVVGIFAVASACWVLARALLPMGWNVAVLRSVSVLRTEGNLAQAGALVRAGFADTALLGCVFGVAVTATAALFSQEYIVAAALASLVGLLWAWIGILVAYLRAMGDLLWSQLCDGVVVYVVPLLVCGSMLAADLVIDFAVIVATYTVSAGLALVLLFAAAVHYGRPAEKGHRNSRIVAEQRRLARRLWWNQAFSALSGRMSVLMAAPVAGVAATAIIEAGLRTQLVGATLAWAGGTVASPRYAVEHKYRSGDGPRILNLVTWAAVLPSVTVFGLLAVWGEPILGVLGPAYVAQRWPITLMALAAVAELPAASGGYFMMMTGRERAANSSTVLQLVVVVVLIAVFGPLLGAIGIACAVLVAAVVRSCVVLVALQRDEIMSPLAARGLLSLGYQVVACIRPPRG